MNTHEENGHGSAVEIIAGIEKAQSSLAQYENSDVVVKVSGSLCQSEEDAYKVGEAIVKTSEILGLVKGKVVVVYGAGPQIQKALNKGGVNHGKKDGLTITTDDNFEIVYTAIQHMGYRLINSLNKHLKYGTMPLKHGSILNPEVVIAKSLGNEYGGRTGKAESINWEKMWQERLINRQDSSGIPLIPSLGVSSERKKYNINADSVAAAVVSKLKPHLYVALTQTGGVLNADGQVQPQLTLEEAILLSSEGMLVKTNSLQQVVENSPHTKIVITSPEDLPYSLIETAGTTIVSGVK